MRRSGGTSKRRLHALVLLAAFSLAGCKQAMYSVTIWNKTSKEINEVVASVSGVGLGMGVISAGFSKTHGTVNLPIPEQVEVRWLGGDSEQHSVSVEIRKWIRKPEKFDGRIHFVVNPNGTVSCIPVRRENSYPLLLKLDKASDGKALEPTAPV